MKIAIVVEKLIQAVALTTTAFAATTEDVAWPLAAVASIHEGAIIADLGTTLVILVQVRIEVTAAVLLVLQQERDGATATTVTG